MNCNCGISSGHVDNLSKNSTATVEYPRSLLGGLQPWAPALHHDWDIDDLVHALDLWDLDKIGNLIELLVHVRRLSLSLLHGLL